MSDGMTIIIGDDGKARAYDDTYDITIHCESKEEQDEVKRRLMSEPHWIPCSERMPEESEWIGTKTFGTTISDEVYVTFESPDGQRFADHINFQNGKLSRSDEQRMKVIYKGAKPIAWMPLPEPYRGGEKAK